MRAAWGHAEFCRMHYNRGAMFDLHPTGEQVEIRRAVRESVEREIKPIGDGSGPPGRGAPRFQATNLGIGQPANEAALEFADGE